MSQNSEYSFSDEVEDEFEEENRLLEAQIMNEDNEKDKFILAENFRSVTELNE